jgi:L-threonylcarbamoyladenylate synthase
LSQIFRQLQVTIEGVNPLHMETKTKTAGEGFDDALALLREGSPVAAPTDTVYGLAADATNGSAVAKIYEAKGRPSFNPLIVHVDGLAMAHRIGVFDNEMHMLAETFWPGALTLVVPLRVNSLIHPLALAGLETVALRMPVGALADLITGLGKPLAAPSANKSGHLSPTSAEAVAASLNGRIELVLDGGPTKIGVESTIIGHIDGELTLLRPGGIAAEAIEAVIGNTLKRPQFTKILAPGMIASHYAPNAKVRRNAKHVEANEALLDFGNSKVPGNPVFGLNLSQTGNLSEAAQNLFSHLQALDAAHPVCIAVAPIPIYGLGEAINDRLQRAAAPREN